MLLANQKTCIRLRAVVNLYRYDFLKFHLFTKYSPHLSYLITSWGKLFYLFRHLFYVQRFTKISMLSVSLRLYLVIRKLLVIVKLFRVQVMSRYDYNQVQMYYAFFEVMHYPF